MQVLSASNNTVSSSVPVSGAAAVLLAKTGESAQSVAFAPVEEVAYSTSAQAYEPDTYEQLRRVRDSETRDSRGSDSEPDRKQADADEAEVPSDMRSQRADAQEAADLELIRELKQRDQEVRAHEQAHAATGGQYAGAATFSYRLGPDGVRYAVGGEVSIDISAVAGNPQATLDKMQQVQRAALAPAEPSSQDRQVAAQASQIAAQALSDIAAQQQEQRRLEQENRQQVSEEDRSELQDARKEQEKAEEKEQQEEPISAGERFAEYNARLRRINEFLLQISVPPPKTTGSVLDDVV